MSGPHVELKLPDRDRRLLAAPACPPPPVRAAYRPSCVIVPVDGPAIRVSSSITPAFGGELCRLRLEALSQAPPSLGAGFAPAPTRPAPPRGPRRLGSCFGPARPGTVYALTPGRGVAAARAPERVEWRYAGASLASR